jgi:hypothetical protein
MSGARVCTHGAVTMSTADGTGAGDGRSALRIACAVLALACVPALTRTVLSVPLRLSLNYNEGWNAYHTLDIGRGAALYARGGGFFFNNYPPLSFVVVAALARVVGDPIVAGRWLSLAAFVAWTIVLAAVAVRFGCRRREAAFAALLFAATTLLFSDYVGIDDPQLLGHAVAGAGLLAIQRGPRTAPRLWLGALMLSAAVFIKGNLIALPLASVAWLLLTDRRAGWRLLTMGAVCGTAGYAACAAIFGPAFFLQLVEPRAYLPLKGLWMAVQWIARWSAAIALLWITSRRRQADEGIRFCEIYVCLAGLFGLVLSGGAGINWNVLFDANWALCLSAAVVLNRWRVTERRVALVAAYLLVPAIAVALGARHEWRSAGYWLAPRAAEVASARQGIDFLARHDGPALCEDLALCFWARKPVEVDVFNTEQSIRRGRVDAADLIRLVQDRYFGAVQIEMSPRDLGGGASAVLRQYYRIDQQGVSGSYLLPR